MKKLIIFVIVLFVCDNIMLGQSYNTVGGIRLADDFGLSVSQRIANKTTLDLIYQPGTFAGREMLSLTARQHYPLITKRLNFYLGGGVAYRNTEFGIGDDPNTKVQSANLAFTLGGEMTIGRLNFSIDYMPMVALNNYSKRDRFNANSGISLKYVFVKKPKSKEKFIDKINIFKKKQK